jgi:Family of unknown function (DUF6069)
MRSRNLAQGRPLATDAARPSLLRVGLVAGLVASAASVLVYVAARAAGIPLELTDVFEDQFRRMSVVSFILGTLLDGAAVATVTAAACRWLTQRPRLWFVALSGIGTLVSFALPVASDGTTATKVVLCISHVVVAVVLVPPLASALPARPRRTLS